ncbi:hypothetical protein HHL11_09605 [Ramlibacter sp. G-1-2-2]|uniref:Uncharacterized protein n=1 Tax=Ramlibacter agri TaxID=2728837 RepID=A0A848H0A3_9BURK|nr:hypothetical protein [Ramlibacter agri]NML44004.1 hypothetical protein [Ramlibacter agri]
MNVFAYVAAVCALGVVAGWALGHLTYRSSRGEALALYLGGSLALGWWLSFSFLELVGSACTWMGKRGSGCIATDDQTVWYLALPLIACPAYACAMFAARFQRNEKARNAKDVASFALTRPSNRE